MTKMMISPEKEKRIIHALFFLLCLSSPLLLLVPHLFQSDFAQKRKEGNRLGELTFQSHDQSKPPIKKSFLFPNKVYNGGASSSPCSQISKCLLASHCVTRNQAQRRMKQHDIIRHSVDLRPNTSRKRYRKLVLRESHS
jgi:hypothetical protein